MAPAAATPPAPRLLWPSCWVRGVAREVVSGRLVPARATQEKMGHQPWPWPTIKAEGVLSWIGTQARRPDGRDARTAHAARPKAAG